MHDFIRGAACHVIGWQDYMNEQEYSWSISSIPVAEMKFLSSITCKICSYGKKPAIEACLMKNVNLYPYICVMCYKIGLFTQQPYEKNKESNIWLSTDSLESESVSPQLQNIPPSDDSISAASLPWRTFNRRLCTTYFTPFLVRKTSGTRRYYVNASVILYFTSCC